MELNGLEKMEHTTFSMVVQALTDYASDAQMIFREETDLPQDIAEDITREAIASMGLPGIQERLYGKVDVKKAIYVFLPEPHPVALMLDAKAEKSNGNRTATIQMSQTSMTVMIKRAGHKKGWTRCKGTWKTGSGNTSRRAKILRSYNHSQVYL